MLNESDRHKRLINRSAQRVHRLERRFPFRRTNSGKIEQHVYDESVGSLQVLVHETVSIDRRSIT